MHPLTATGFRNHPLLTGDLNGGEERGKQSLLDVVHMEHLAGGSPRSFNIPGHSGLSASLRKSSVAMVFQNQSKDTIAPGKPSVS